MLATLQRIDRLVKDNFVLAITSVRHIWEKADVILPGATFVESQGTAINNGVLYKLSNPLFAILVGLTKISWQP